MVDINFSRYDSSDESLSKTDVTYMLVFKDNMWNLREVLFQVIYL